MAFIRFVLMERIDGTDSRLGVIRGAVDLEESGKLSLEEARKVREIHAWLNKNLPTPPRFNTSKSKGFYRRKPKGLSWFRDSAVECLAYMRALAEILERHGYYVRVLTTDKPGYVIYEDEYQVVAEPFSDTPK